MTKIQGIFSAAATPIDASGAPALDLFAQHCLALLDEGCNGIALLGTTGEANNFSVRERMDLLDAALSFGVHGDQLLPGCSTSNIPESIELVRHAVQNDVLGCVMLPPFYYKGISDEGLFRFYAKIIETIADDRLKIILYHIPQVTQIPITHDLIWRLRTEFPDTVVGIKDSAGDIENMIMMIQMFPDFSVLAGADPLLLPLLQAGGAGCITATSNLRADSLRVVWDHYSNPDQADTVKAAQDRINAWRSLTNSYVQLPTVKAMVAKARGHRDWLNLRAPLVALSETEITHIWSEMDRLG